MIYSKEFIREKLFTSNRWLKRGIIRIAEFQTPDELKSEQTIIRNSLGFNSSDANYLTNISKKINVNSNLELTELLTKEEIRISRVKMLKYSGQLTKLANGKLNVIN